MRFFFIFFNDHSSQTPVLEDVRDITVGQNSKNGLVVLVSYENKVRFATLNELRDPNHSLGPTSTLETGSHT